MQVPSLGLNNLDHNPGFPDNAAAGAEDYSNTFLVVAAAS